MLGGDGVSLPRVALERLARRPRRPRPARPAARRTSARSSSASPWRVSRSVCAISATRLAGERLRLVDPAAPGEELRAHPAPDHLRREILGAPPCVSLTAQNRSASPVALLRVERLGEHRRGGGEQSPSRPSPRAARSRGAAARRPPRGCRRASRPAPRGARPPTASGRASSRIAFASRISERASSNSPRIAWSAASGWSVTATATGLLPTCSRISVARADRLRRPGSGRRPRPEARQPRISNSSRSSPARARVDGGAPPRLVRRGRVALESTRSTPAGTTPGTGRRRRRAPRRPAAPRRRPRRASPIAPPASACRRTNCCSTRARDSSTRVGARRLDRLGEDVLGLREPAGLEQRLAEARAGAAPPRRPGAARAPARTARPSPAGRCGRTPSARPRGAGGRRARRAPRRGCRARAGTGTPARGGSRRARPRRPAPRAARRRARGGRRGRSSGCRRRRRRGSARGGSGSPPRARSGRAGRAACGRARAAAPGRSSRSSGGVRSSTASSEKLRPATAARSSSGALLALEPVEPLVEDAADRARHLAGGAVLVGDRGELLDEERVALGGLGDPRRGRRPATPSASSSRSRVGLRERLEHERRRRRLQPGRPPLGQLGAARGRAGAPARRRAAPARYSTKSRNVGSAQWTSSNATTSGRSARELLEHPARGGEDLVARARELAVVAAGLPQQLAQRPEGDRPRRTAGSGRRARSPRPRARPRNSRASRDLPIPGSPTIVDLTGAAAAGDLGEDAAQPVELALAADQRRVVAARHRRRLGVDATRAGTPSPRRACPSSSAARAASPRPRARRARASRSPSTISPAPRASLRAACRARRPRR